MENNHKLEKFSILDTLGISDEVLHNLSSTKLDEFIENLNKLKYDVKTLEEKERKRKKQEEIEQKKSEEQAKKDAHIQEVTCMELPLDWENVFDLDVRTQAIHVENIPDALIMCLTTLGKVDIEYIASITGSDYKTVIQTLKGAIFQNPNKWDECFYKGWETAEEYLSGNLMRKWKEANIANKKYKGYFYENIKAIEKVLPPTVATEDIYVTLGSPWIPPDVIDDFMIYLFGDPFVFGSCNHNVVARKEMLTEHKTIYDEITGIWEIPWKSRYSRNYSAKKTYGTDRLGPLHILEKTLNLKSITITDEVACSTNKSGKKRVINESETIAVLEKQKILIKAFQDWVWKDEIRKERLEIIFENKFSCVRKRDFDGSFLTFPQMSETIKLYPYQKNAIARIIFTSNTLLAHEVGAGKTYVMIAAGQELKRMGLSNKNMYVVPNNIVGQWKDMFLSMYPNAKVLCVEPRNFVSSKCMTTLKHIRDNDYDGIIIAYSCFTKISLSREYYIREKESEYEKILNYIKNAENVSSNLRKKLDNVKKELQDLVLSKENLDKTIFFDELGINRLFVDEAHNFKNVPIETKINNVLGINSKGSKKCKDMMDKVHMIQKKNNGKGVVFATGTPIINSITDAYIMQKYLQSGELAMLDLQNFDSWIGMFVEKTTEFEIDVDTSSYRLANRFAKFHNLPELTSLLSSFADFYQNESRNGIPDFEGYRDELIPKTNAFALYLNDISNRIERIRNREVLKSKDNMLKVTTDGRKAALDYRLVESSSQFTFDSKVARCVENVTNIYFQTMSNKSAQLIFCDTSVPKDEFNIYDELKDLFIRKGIVADHIAFIHDADSEDKRLKLFNEVRNGDIRILIGSTFKLGVGVNVQERLIAIHHIDVPWRPSDMIQREGRILRQGNTNGQVYIYRYITEGSFDAYSWQLLETKQKIISGLLSGSLTQRSASDVENTVLNYAEVKALVIGDPLIKQRVEAANELAKYVMLQRKLVDVKTNLEQELLGLPGQIKNQIKNIEECKLDMKVYEKWKKDNSVVESSVAKKVEAENRKQLRKSIWKALQNYTFETKEKVLMSYRGFDIMIPPNMLNMKPYVWLLCNGRYYVELGNSEKGNLIRIDNFLDSLEQYLDNLKLKLSMLYEQEKLIKEELMKNESYAPQIEKYKKLVKQLDNKLGVKQ